MLIACRQLRASRGMELPHLEQLIPVRRVGRRQALLIHGLHQLAKVFALGRHAAAPKLIVPRRLPDHTRGDCGPFDTGP